MSYNATMGRKKKKPADKRSAVLKILLTPAEKASIDAAARADMFQETSAWVRLAILQIIRDKRQ